MTFEIFGVPTRWVVECKRWKSKVKKENVETLKAICADVGANAGYLLSERGFQPGAVRAAEHTNITLTSIGDLQTRAEGHLQERAAIAIHQQLADLQHRMHAFSRVVESRPGFSQSELKAGLDSDSYFWWLANLAAVDEGLKRVRLGAYPAEYGWARETDSLRRAMNLRDFVAGAEETLSAAAKWVAAEEARPWKDLGK